MNEEIEKNPIVDEIKDSEQKVKNFQKSYDAITSIAKDGLASNIIKLIAMLFLGLGWLFMRKQIRKKNIERATELSEVERKNLKKYLLSIEADDSIVTDLENF